MIAGDSREIAEAIGKREVEVSFKSDLVFELR